ncbi:MAG: MupG family TIM beta-alpha barrel fold protein [Propionibacteriaceae bacterium]|jgi:hypothetical protein|nr:MupG family TIM beta-alpha barrel fold protein [Propionibacteriaceae bacterium]
MLYSIYPTDELDTREEVLNQAGSGLVFTSLHIPEAGLGSYVEYLRAAHRRGFTFCADISPLALEKLGIGIGELGRLREVGVELLRIDFGFSSDEIRLIAGQIPIAVNASTVSETELDGLAEFRPVGWHNYYPRPETGLSADFYVSQCRMFTERGLELYSFIPGERSFRAPLHLGLPTLEVQRYRNAYANYLELARLVPQARIVCAEGALLARHLEWIRAFETGVLTLPLVEIAPNAEFLLEGTWRIRVDQADASWRLEGSRSNRTPQILNASVRERGSIQMDLPSIGRYQGEIHIMRRDLALSQWQARVARIASPYVDLVDAVVAGGEVRFVRF